MFLRFKSNCMGMVSTPSTHSFPSLDLEVSTNSESDTIKRLLI